MTNRIHVDSPMLHALREGSAGYIPVFNGVDLAAEGQWPETSLSNLRKLLDRCYKVVSLIAGPGGVLVVFSNGEQYLATGFSVGRQIDEDGKEHRSVATIALATFAAEAGLGSEASLFKHFDRLPEDYSGEIGLPAVEASAIHIHTA